MVNRKSLIHRLEGAADNLGQRSAAQRALMDQPHHVKEHIRKPTARTIMGSIYYTGNAAMARMEEEQVAKDQRLRRWRRNARSGHARRRKEKQTRPRGPTLRPRRNRKSLRRRRTRRARRRKGKKAAP